MLACSLDNFSTPPQRVTITAIHTPTSNTSSRNWVFTYPTRPILGEEVKWHSSEDKYEGALADRRYRSRCFCYCSPACNQRPGRPDTGGKGTRRFTRTARHVFRHSNMAVHPLLG